MKKVIIAYIISILFILLFVFYKKDSYTYTIPIEMSNVIPENDSIEIPLPDEWSNGISTPELKFSRVIENPPPMWQYTSLSSRSSGVQIPELVSAQAPQAPPSAPAPQAPPSAQAPQAPPSTPAPQAPPSTPAPSAPRAPPAPSAPPAPPSPPAPATASGSLKAPGGTSSMSTATLTTETSLGTVNGPFSVKPNTTNGGTHAITKSGTLVQTWGVQPNLNAVRISGVTYPIVFKGAYNFYIQSPGLNVTTIPSFEAIRR